MENNYFEKLQARVEAARRKEEYKAANRNTGYSAFYIGGGTAMLGAGFGQLINKYSREDRKFRNNGIILMIAGVIYTLVGCKMMKDAENRIHKLDEEEEA